MKSFFHDTGRDILVQLVVTLLVALLGAIYSSYKTTGDLNNSEKEFLEIKNEIDYLTKKAFDIN